MTSLSQQAPKVPIPKNGVDYRGKIVLAPMVRSGELPSRLVALKYGADLVWGPETIDRALIGSKRRINPRNSVVEYTRVPSNGGRADEAYKESIIYRVDRAREKSKLIFQLGTASPELAVEAAKLVADDVSGIDVNAGCPKPFSTIGGMGAALLQTPDKLVSILEALVREVGEPWQIGISVKIRILKEPERTAELVTRLCATGITGLTVHCRTTPMRPREAAIRDQLRTVSAICKKAGVACLMNGDVSSRDDGLRLMEEYGVDGAMIATSAEANFSCFRSAADGGPVSLRELAHDYIEAAIRCENKWGNTKFMLNIILPGKEARSKEAKQARTYTQCCTILEFDDLIPLAMEADENVGLNQKAELDAMRKAAAQKALEERENAKEASIKSKAKSSADPSAPLNIDPPQTQIPDSAANALGTENTQPHPPASSLTA